MKESYSANLKLQESRALNARMKSVCSARCFGIRTKHAIRIRKNNIKIGLFKLELTDVLNA